MSDRAKSEMTDALEAVLLFFKPPPWTREHDLKWQELTGTEGCTNKNLCDFVRKALGKVAE